MPSLLRFLVVIAIIFGLGHAGRPEAARDHRHGAARQIRQAALRAAMPRPPRNSPQRLTGLFLDMLAAERGAGPNTLEAYTRDLDDLAAHLAGTRTTIATASTADLRAYLGTLAARGFKASSVARRLSAIRQLYRFLYAEGHRRDDPAAVIEGPKRGRVLPKVLSIAEVDGLLAAPPAGAHPPAPPGPHAL